MNTTFGVSIIICCHNSVKRLPKTLQHLMAQEFPAEIPWEVLVIDNASTDNIAQVANDLWQSEVPLRVVSEPNLGLSNARNCGLRESKGELICFIDDDVRPKEDWLRNIYDFALATDVDAIAGKVTLPECLSRPWMQQRHRTKLASTENIDTEKPQEMIGANMAFRRRVLDKVPRFDSGLGAGASGFGEESLFSRQILEAGFIIGFAENAIVEHHFNERRLSHIEWLKGERKRGVGSAYIAYHWEHTTIDKPLKEYLRSVICLLRWRLSHQDEISKIEGCSIKEMSLVRKISFLRQYMIESRKPRTYDYHGLVKIS